MPFLLVLFFLPVATSFSLSQRSSSCPVILPEDKPTSTRPLSFRQPLSPRIINGDSISSSLIPYTVAIMQQPSGVYKAICSGSVIAPGWVLTAAHCRVDPATTKALVLSSFDDSYISNPALLLDILEVHVPPLYRLNEPDNPYDVLVFRVSANLSRVMPMKLMDAAQYPRKNTMARVAGYGQTVFPADRLSVRPLLQVDVPIADMEKCRKVYASLTPPGFVDREKHVCAGYLDGTQRECGSCFGDSGGPLFQYDQNAEPVVVAVVSFGAYCGAPQFPTVYVRVSAHIQWIRENVPGIVTVSRTNEVAYNPRRVSVAMAVGISIAVAVVILIVVVAIFAVRKRKHAKNAVIIHPAPSNFILHPPVYTGLPPGGAGPPAVGVPPGGNVPSGGSIHPVGGVQYAQPWSVQPEYGGSRYYAQPGSVPPGYQSNAGMHVPTSGTPGGVSMPQTTQEDTGPQYFSSQLPYSTVPLSSTSQIPYPTAPQYSTPQSWQYSPSQDSAPQMSQSSSPMPPPIVPLGVVPAVQQGNGSGQRTVEDSDYGGVESNHEKT